MGIPETNQPIPAKIRRMQAWPTRDHPDKDQSISHSPRDILSSRENPKICGIDDAKVVCDLVAVDRPVPRHLLAQKSQYRTSEILEPSVAFVMGAVPVHQSPQSFDRIQMWAV